jgi:multicomponent K+:H+ antiporter subunit A
MAGIPPLNGFVSKEMFLKETLQPPPVAGLEEAAWILPAVGALAAVLGVAYSIRYVVEVYFGSGPADYPREPHEPRWGMRLPVELLVAACVVIGFLPQTAAGALVESAAGAALGGAAPEVYLSLWHGFNLPLLLSGIGVLGGALLWLGRGRMFALHEGPLPLPEAKRFFDAAVDGLVALSRGVTSRLENGSLQRYLVFIVAVTLAVAAVPTVTGTWSVDPAVGIPTDPISVAGLIILIVGAIGTVVLHRRRILAVVSLSVVGLVIALAFVHFSAPDLALTQLSVEVVTIVLLLLALYYLPPGSPVDDGPGRRFGHGVLAVLAGAGMATATWFLLNQPLDSISGFHLAQSKPGGGGANVVNVILVDFRGYDTLGEITVLGIAALGIYALVDGLGLPTRWDPRDLDDEERHPLLLLVVTRLLLPLALAVGVYLFLRGHNHPGGGFIAGLVVAVALILQFVAAGIGWSQARLRRHFHPLIGLGLVLAVGTGVGAWIFGRPFLTGWFEYYHLPLLGEVEVASAVLFDLGVFLTVVGVVLLILVNLGKMSEAKRMRLPERFRSGS